MYPCELRWLDSNWKYVWPVGFEQYSNSRSMQFFCPGGGGCCRSWCVEGSTKVCCVGSVRP